MQESILFYIRQAKERDAVRKEKKRKGGGERAVVCNARKQNRFPNTANTQGKRKKKGNARRFTK